MTYAELIRTAVYFDGEFEAIEAEFCGSWSVPLLRLPDAKRKRLEAWLRFPTDERARAFAEVRDWATAPIAAALDRLRDPAKYQPKPKRTRQDRTADTLARWLEEEGEL